MVEAILPGGAAEARLFGEELKPRDADITAIHWEMCVCIVRITHTYNVVLCCFIV